MQHAKEILESGMKAVGATEELLAAISRALDAGYDFGADDYRAIQDAAGDSLLVPLPRMAEFAAQAKARADLQRNRAYVASVRRMRDASTCEEAFAAHATCRVFHDLAVRRHRPRPTRAPRPAPSRRQGSRRTSSSSRTSGTDPGDPDPEPSSPRICGGCGEELVGKAPQARFHSDVCRKRAERARQRDERPSRPIWPVAGIEPVSVLAVLMADPPHGAVTEAVPA